MVMAAGLTMLLVETLLIAFLFSHNQLFAYYLPDAYRWLRDYRIAEITVDGYIRIFFQSHIYVLFGFILASLAFIRGRQPWLMAVACGSLMTLLILSYSRSFWVASAAILLILTVLAKRQWWRYVGMVLVSSALGYALVFAILNVTIGGNGGAQSDLASLLSDRVTVTTDAASGSRMALIKPLILAALQHPLLGSGFGTYVTYRSQDPRIQDLYTTFAFEWGYLDLWLKFGAIFALVWVLVVSATAVYTWRVSQNVIPQAAALGVIALMVIHVFTPYLNHPLGIGWVVLTAVIGTIYAKPNTTA